MEPFSQRKLAVETFVSEVKPQIKVDAVQIFDAFGPTITGKHFNCFYQISGVAVQAMYAVFVVPEDQ